MAAREAISFLEPSPEGGQVREPSAVPALVRAAAQSQGFFFKYIAANDTGSTGAHQAGFYMPRETWSLFFERPGEKGENSDCWIDVAWPQLGMSTRSRFIWYGRAKSEYRLTNGFSFLTQDQVGDVLVLIRESRARFLAFLLSRDEDIDSFFESFSLSPEDAYRLQQTEAAEESLLREFCDEWLATEPPGEFPEARSFSEQAREFRRRRIGSEDLERPDEILLDWIDTEFRLFKAAERHLYARWLEQPFASVDQMIEVANTVLNRRKSRSGLALENHLCYLFSRTRVPFAYQEVTEHRSRPDFIFPSALHYRDTTFPAESLTFLAVKTTCKDRWRQILTEAERIPNKYLFTLQQGISAAQLREMGAAGVSLVIPAGYRKHFPREFRGQLISLSDFLARVRVAVPGGV